MGRIIKAMGTEYDYFPYFVMGCIFWPSVFHTVWLLMSRRVTDAQACGTAMRVVSIIHAIMASVVGTISVAATYRDIIYDNHWLLNYFAAFAYPYMPYDTYAMYQVFIREKKMQDTGFLKQLTFFLKAQKLEVFHHAISTFLGYPIILHYRHNKGTFIVGSVYITEYSTPFVNIRKILIKNGYGSSKMFTVNDFLVLIMFFLVRVALWPAMYVVYAVNKEMTVNQVLMNMPSGCHIAMTIVMVLQTSWFVLFCRSFIKSLVGPSRMTTKLESGGGGDANGYVDLNGKKTD